MVTALVPTPRQPHYHLPGERGRHDGDANKSLALLSLKYDLSTQKLTAAGNGGRGAFECLAGNEASVWWSLGMDTHFHIPPVRVATRPDVCLSYAELGRSIFSLCSRVRLVITLYIWAFWAFILWLGTGWMLVSSERFGCHYVMLRCYLPQKLS